MATVSLRWVTAPKVALPLWLIFRHHRHFRARVGSDTSNPTLIVSVLVSLIRHLLHCNGRVGGGMPRDASTQISDDAQQDPFPHCHQGGSVRSSQMTYSTNLDQQCLFMAIVSLPCVTAPKVALPLWLIFLDHRLFRARVGSDTSTPTLIVSVLVSVIRQLLHCNGRVGGGMPRDASSQMSDEAQQDLFPPLPSRRISSLFSDDIQHEY